MIKSIPKLAIFIFVVLFLLGIGTGYILSGNKKGISINTSTIGGKGANVKSGQTFGSNDEKTFKDQAEGVLKEGGADGEGAFHLERPGGESQNVYLTSSVIDLTQFLNRKVRVWGETNSAKKAGWLMDVGRLQVL